MPTGVYSFAVEICQHRIALVLSDEVGEADMEMSCQLRNAWRAEQVQHVSAFQRLS